MLILGLTGGIATGKSTVSEILSQTPYNIPIIDADILARRVVAPGTRAYKKIIAYFGPIIPDLLSESVPSSNSKIDLNDGDESKSKLSNGTPLNRVALARCVFGNSPENRVNRGVLNSIVHPAVRREMMKEVLKNYIRGHWIIVLDVPLLFESHLDLFCSTILVIAVKDAKLQMSRLQSRDIHLSQADAEARVQSQADLSAKVRKCKNRGKDHGFVIYNDDGIEELKREIQRVLDQIKKSHPQWWTWTLWFSPPLACFVGIWHIGRSWFLNRRWELQEEQSRAKI